MTIRIRFWNSVVTCTGNVATVRNFLSSYELTLSFGVLFPHLIIQQCRSTHHFYYFLLSSPQNRDESPVIIKVPWKKNCDDEIEFISLGRLSNKYYRPEWKSCGEKIVSSCRNIEFVLDFEDIEIINISEEKNRSEQPGHPQCFIDCTENALYIVDESRLLELCENNEREFKSQPIPFARPNVAHVVDFACGKAHCVLLDSDGLVYTEGSGSRGQLGRHCADVCIPGMTLKVVEHLVGLRIKSIAVGGWHSLALTDFGDVYGWGWNADNQLTLDKSKITIVDEPNYIQIHEEEDVGIRQIACGSRFSVIITEAGEILVSGYVKNDFHSDTFQLNQKKENLLCINFDKDKLKTMYVYASSANLTICYTKSKFHLDITELEIFWFFHSANNIRSLFGFYSKQDYPSPLAWPKKFLMFLTH